MQFAVRQGPTQDTHAPKWGGGGRGRSAGEQGIARVAHSLCSLEHEINFDESSKIN